jgi:hypothetical protein
MSKAVKKSRVTKALEAISDAKKQPAAKAAKPTKPAKPAKESRSVAKRKAVQKGEPMPETFDDPMDPGMSPPGVVDQWVTCPNCGNQQADMGASVVCEACGEGPMPTSYVGTTDQAESSLDEPLPDDMPGEDEPTAFIGEPSEPSTALTFEGDADEKFLDIDGKFRLTKTGLKVIGDPTFIEWESVGHILKTVEGAVQFWVADWVNYGEDQFKERASQAIDATGWKYATIQQYSRVAKKIPAENRRPELSFSHHREVADLTTGEQTKWLDKAAKGDKDGSWSSTELRLQLAAKKKKAGKGKPQKWWLVVECKSEQDREELMASFTESGRTVLKAENFGPNALRERMGITANNDLASVGEA